jgi:hypothetical protein
MELISNFQNMPSQIEEKIDDLIAIYPNFRIRTARINLRPVLDSS